ncbi:hypothetical protein Aduo_006894 [Ancylostoma duodenale]
MPYHSSDAAHDRDPCPFVVRAAMCHQVIELRMAPGVEQEAAGLDTQELQQEEPEVPEAKTDVQETPREQHYYDEKYHLLKNRKYSQRGMVHDGKERLRTACGTIHATRHEIQAKEEVPYCVERAIVENAALDHRVDSMIPNDEQLLWDYGMIYAAATILGQCICNKCLPDLLRSSSTELAPLQDFPGPWREEPSMHAHTLDWEPAPLTIKSLSMSVALEANVALCRLINASIKDSFELGNPVVLRLKESRRRAETPLILLLGEVIPEDSRNGTGIAWYSENRTTRGARMTYPMAEQTRTSLSDSVHRVYSPYNIVNTVTAIDDA